MDTEKGFQADTSFQTKPYWASCHTCRATQKKQFIIKSIFGLVLLGLLALSSYQSIHALPTNLSSLQLELHNALSVEAQGHHNLSLMVEDSVTTDDTPWAFTVFTDDGCKGNTTSQNGDGPSTSCQPLNQPYNATSVGTLDDSLKICFYPEKECDGQPQDSTKAIICQNIPESSSYWVIPSSDDCQFTVT